MMVETVVNTTKILNIAVTVIVMAVDLQVFKVTANVMQKITILAAIMMVAIAVVLMLTKPLVITIALPKRYDSTSFRDFLTPIKHMNYTQLENIFNS